MTLSRNQLGIGKFRLSSAWYLADLLSAMLLVILCLIFFRKVLFDTTYMFPWDFVAYMYPTKRFVSEVVRSGNLPLWDPYVLLGYPIIGDPQASIFNPLYRLYDLIPMSPPLDLGSFEWLEVIYIANAGVCTYALGRTIGIQKAGSLFAGVTYMLGGFFPVHLEHETWVAASSWIPLLLLLAMKMFDNPKPRFIVIIALVIASSLFAGYPQTTLLSIYLLVAFLVWSSVSPLRRNEFGVVIKNSLCLTAAVALGLVISAIQFLPSAEFALNSSRNAVSFTGPSGGDLQPVALVTLVFPKLLGSDGASSFIGGEVTHSQKYSGLISLVLALTGLMGLLMRRRTGTKVKFAGFLAALMLLAFAASFGHNFLVYRALEFLPFMTMFQRPAALFPLALLGLALLAGAECDFLVPSVSRPASEGTRDLRNSWSRWRIAFLLSAILSLGYLVSATSPQITQGVFAVFQRGILPAQLTEESYLPTIQRNAMEMLPIPFLLLAILFGIRILPRARRIMTSALVFLSFIDLYQANSNQIFNLIERAPYEELSKLPFLLHLVSSDPLGTSRLALTPYRYMENAGNVLHVEELNGYNPLKLSRVDDFVKNIPSIDARLFDLTNVKYIVVPDPSNGSSNPPQTFSSIASGVMFYLPEESPNSNKFRFLATGMSDWYSLYENRDVLPRFFTTNEYQIVSDSNQRLSTLRDRQFDLTRIVLLEEPYAERLVGRLNGRVGVVYYGINGLELTANIDGGRTLLFVGIPYFPGWNAYVNGVPTKVLIADHAFIAVPLGPGENRIRMSFEPMSFKLGALITAIGIASCVFALAGASRLDARFRLPRE